MEAEWREETTPNVKYKLRGSCMRSSRFRPWCELICAWYYILLYWALSFVLVYLFYQERIKHKQYMIIFGQTTLNPVKASGELEWRDGFEDAKIDSENIWQRYFCWDSQVKSGTTTAVTKSSEWAYQIFLFILHPLQMKKSLFVKPATFITGSNSKWIKTTRIMIDLWNGSFC